MKTSGLLLLSGFFFLSACESPEPLGSPQAKNDSAMTVEQKEIWAYQDAPLLVSDLNEHLKRAGAPTCAMKNPDLQTGYAEKISNQGAAVCRFTDGTPLFVLIVRNGEATYEHHFSGAHGPNVYLRGPTWILITPHTAPPEAFAEIRQSLGATG